MSGHSKWSNIQHRKNAQDAKRGKIFTKLIREITVAARMGGDDIDANPRLRLAVDKALAQNMTKDTIDRAIKRGAGGLEGSELEQLTYEGYGPGGVAVLANCMTDNRNRTVAEVRHAFSRAGGNLGTTGSVAYIFRQVGQILFAPGVEEDTVMEIALDRGAEDVIVNEDMSIEVVTTAETFAAIRQAMEEAELTIADAELTMLPSTQTPLDKDTAEKLFRMIDNLEDLDDVQEVYHNADISDAIMEELHPIS